MIAIKNKVAMKEMETAGAKLASLFDLLQDISLLNKTTLAIDTLIMNYLVTEGLVSQCKGYRGYQHVSCISINDEIVHGVPREKYIREGDIVKIDVCASWRGYCADMARCFIVGPSTPLMTRLIATATSALDKGIAQALPGKHIGDISSAIQAEVEHNHFSVIRDFAGHGIGVRMHEEPEILNYGTAGKGPRIAVGMAFAIEPMISAGGYKVCIDSDGWTARTADGSLAAHIEDTVLVTEEGPKVVTRNKIW